MSIPAQLNHYRILGPLGKGGMGEVFVAEDTRLHRKVAVKVLSELMAVDTERRQRFEREAQAIAALNHPNIVTIHSVEEAEGVPFIVMELVEGRPLSDSIKAGGLPLDVLLRVGIAISDAIGAAHQRGITHRDLKPANVMIGNDGRVKVLDFGLAKLREEEAEYDGETRLPADDLTGEGRIIGTVAYMSPEQAEGKSVDPRSDIFSLGVMLHEMAVGERPFQGDTNVSVISSILKDTPSAVTARNPALPEGLAKVIRRSLSKDPSRRYQTAIDLRNELDELKQEVDSGIRSTVTSGVRPAPGTAAPNRTKTIALAGGVLVLALLAAAGYYWRGARPAVASGFAADRFTRLTTSGAAQLAAISGDGRYVVHIKNEGLQPSLWVRQTAAASDVQIVAPAAVRYDGLTFSPDGNFVYYVTYEPTGGVAFLYRVPVLGGASQRVLEDIDSRPSFSPDGQRFAFVRGFPANGRNYVMIANVDGSGVRQLGTAESPTQVLLDAPAWSPDGQTIVVAARSLQDGPHALYLAFDANTGVPTPVGGRWAGAGDSVWAPDGTAFLAVAAEFSSSQALQLWAITFPSGERRRITNDLNNYSGVTISSDGRAIATVQNEVSSSIWTAPASDLSKASRISGDRNREGTQGLAWTGDGRIVYGSSASGAPQVWVAQADGTGATQLSNAQGGANSPATPASGAFVVFQQLQENGVHLQRASLDGSGVKQITKGPLEFLPIVSPDGRWVYYNTFAAGPNRPARVPADGGEPTLLEGGNGFTATGVSPDGTQLIGNTWDAAARRSSVALLPVEGGTPKLLGLPVVGSSSFSADGKAVTYFDVANGQSVLMSRDLASGISRPLHAFGKERVFGFAWSHDGQKAAFGRGTVSNDVVMISSK